MICPNCREDVNGCWENKGLGKYEYWGQTCSDDKMLFVCEQCGEELENENSYAEDMYAYMEDMDND